MLFLFFFTVECISLFPFFFLYVVLDKNKKKNGVLNFDTIVLSYLLQSI